MKIKVPTFGARTIPARDLELWERRKWKFHSEIGDTAYQVRKKYTAWEQFEMKARELFKRAGFKDVIDDCENFYYNALGVQVDVCGGIDDYFVVLDCTTSDRRAPVKIKAKIRENHAKKARILKGLQRNGKKYKNLVIGVCVDGAEVTRPDLRESEELDVPIIDVRFLENCAKYLDTLGDTIRYQLLSRLGVKGISIREGDAKYFEFPAMALHSGPRVLYSFCADPETLLKICYVHRLDRFQKAGISAT
jgi:hypothetical protein